MAVSLIILLDESCRMQQEALSEAYIGGISAAVVNNISEIKKYSGPESVIIIDTCFTDNKSARYEQIRRVARAGAIFVFSGYEDIRMCQAAMALYGDPEQVMPPLIIKQILENNVGQAGSAFPSSPVHIKGNAPSMCDLYETAAAVAATGFNLVIYGETGTGKEALARLIHESSRRKDKPFITLDCGCLNKETALSELFGHVKGAFTDASIAKTGAFEQADGGTLFLDELANLSQEVQVALLRAVQEKEVRKLGAVNSIKCDVRIIAATNEHLAGSGFRKDLYYRLNEMSLHLPPLRERGNDIIQLAEFFLDNVCRELNIHGKVLSDCAGRKLLEYPWPGNVRELKNVIKRTCLLSRGQDLITAGMLQLDSQAAFEVPADQESGLKDAVQRAEYDQIITTLRSVQFNKRKAAALLNIHRKTLYNKLKGMKELFN